jgi:hypothetical protein
VAVLYRKVDRDTPTLLLDEMDNYPLDDRRDALTVLNDGYKRGTTVDRCKENGDLISFDAYSPKGYAGLDTGADVAVPVDHAADGAEDLRGAGGDVDRPSRRTGGRAAPRTLRGVGRTERSRRWPDTGPTARPVQPRRRGVVTLLAIAEHAGGAWPRRTAEAAKAFASGGDDTDDTPDQVQLLLDIRDAFADEIAITTSALLAKLNDLDESPWGARRKGEGLDARGLARMLRPFKVKSRTVRVGDKTAKGYHLDQFDDAFLRHLPEGSQGSQGSQASQPASVLERDVTDVTDVTDIRTRSRGIS